MQQQPSTAHAKLFLKRQLCLWYLIYWGFTRPQPKQEERLQLPIFLGASASCQHPPPLLGHIYPLCPL